MTSITNPTAGIVVYSYVDRGGSNGIKNRDTIRIPITKSLISISTAKYKSRPSGSFEVRLAPSRNWTAVISPGSWIEIHMSPYRMAEGDLKESSEKTLKMIGVIDSVRMSISVDQTTGARSTIYSLRGRDWGAVLESFLYIDSAVISSKENPQVNANLFLNQTKVKDIGLLGTFTPADMAKKLINVWGVSMAFAASGTLNNFKDKAKYALPAELAKKTAQGSTSSLIADAVKIVSGKLNDKDKYAPSNESFGVLNPQSLVGTNTVWQLLHAHSNMVLNELVADLRWEPGSEKPVFALYQRIKPFRVREANTAGYASSFFYIKQHKISKTEVVSIDVGDNAEDIINFIEILPDYSISSVPAKDRAGLLSQLKPKSSVVDVVSLSRHGLKPLMYSSIFAPASSGGNFDWSRVKDWLPILKDWYFDTHKMLNGRIEILGQVEYIGVGNNILIDSSILGQTSFVRRAGTKLLAHIESVSHTFKYENNGARSFITSINFIRGVIVNANGDKLVSDDAFGIETKTNDLPDAQTNIKNTYVE